MNKKLIAIALVLMLVTSGLFAFDVTSVPHATATLKGNIGEFLDHGFTVNNVPYLSAVEILDAFDVDNPPSFVYGYRTNVGGTYEFHMRVSNFQSQTNSAHIVTIDSVKKGNDLLTLSGSGSTAYYEIFTESNPLGVMSGVKSDAETFTIIPSASDIDSANPGSYVATVTFSITT
jgi:hypothetical protein